MKLSTQEHNLISIYHSGSRWATTEQICEAIPCMDNSDVLVAYRTITALKTMSDADYAACGFDEGDHL